MRSLAVVLWQLHAIPLLWLWVLHRHGQRREQRWWLMASAFGVSWVANLFGFLGWSAEAGQVYPVMQASLFGMAMLPRFGAGLVSMGVISTALFSIAIRHGIGFDVWLHVVAFVATALGAFFVLPSSRLRAELAIGFTALAALWPLSVHWTAWPTATYLAYQAAWLLTILAWCDAAEREGYDAP